MLAKIIFMWRGEQWSTNGPFHNCKRWLNQHRIGLQMGVHSLPCCVIRRFLPWAYAVLSSPNAQIDSYFSSSALTSSKPQTGVSWRRDESFLKWTSGVQFNLCLPNQCLMHLWNWLITHNGPDWCKCIIRTWELTWCALGGKKKVAKVVWCQSLGCSHYQLKTYLMVHFLIVFLNCGPSCVSSSSSWSSFCHLVCPNSIRQ